MMHTLILRNTFEISIMKCHSLKKTHSFCKLLLNNKQGMLFVFSPLGPLPPWVIVIIVIGVLIGVTAVIGISIFLLKKKG